MLAAFVLALVLAPAADVAVITPDQARNHVGREMVVAGQVAQVGASKDGHTLFLNFGGSYPFHAFNAVILSRNLQSFPEARSWEGKTIKVRGKIQLYKGKGKPEIILESQQQVTIDPQPTLPQAAVPGGTAGEVQSGVVGGEAVVDYDSPPRAIKITRPQYPQQAFAEKIEGTVLVEILIDTQGRVAKARVIQSVPLLDAAALETVYQWVFQPAVKHGGPVAILAQVPVYYRIYQKGPPEKQREQQPAKRPE
jgi:TonB family protein